MKAGTQRLVELDRRHLWHPFTQMKEWQKSTPLIIERGRGNWLIDTEGRRFLDGISSLWVTVHGHGKKELDRAIRAQLRRIAHSTLLGLGNFPSIELAERLLTKAPGGRKRGFFSDDGAPPRGTTLKIALHTQ